MTTAVFLNNDKTMPLLGLGVYKATGDNEAESAIVNAVQCGYRLIDTASAYKNEENVGRGIARCGVPRKELFYHNKDMEQRSASWRRKRGFPEKPRPAWP